MKIIDPTFSDDADIESEFPLKGTDNGQGSALEFGGPGRETGSFPARGQAGELVGGRLSRPTMTFEGRPAVSASRCRNRPLPLLGRTLPGAGAEDEEKDKP